MSEVVPAETPLPVGPFSCQHWSRALRALRDLLQVHHGVVSSIALVRELKKRHGIEDPYPLIVELTYIDANDLRERGLEVPDFEFRHLGRSFYAPEQYNEAKTASEEETEREAYEAGRSVDAIPEEEVPVTRANRQEEARLTSYVKRALEALYTTDYVPENSPFVFDV